MIPLLFLRFQNIVFSVFLFTNIIFISSAEETDREYAQYIQHARHAEERHRYQEALDWYEKALMIREDVVLLVAKAKQLIGLERLDEACETLRAVISRAPDHAEAHTLLANYHAHIQQNWKDAEYHYQIAIKADERYLPPHWLLGKLYLKLQHYHDAEDAFSGLFRLDSDSYEANVGLGEVKFKQFEYPPAEIFLKKAVSLRPDEPEPHRLLAQVLSAVGKRDEAKAELETYRHLNERADRLTGLLRDVRRSPLDADKWFALGAEYFRRKQINEAGSALRKGLELNPEYPTAHVMLGTLYLGMQKIDAAREHLQTAIRLAPDSADAYNNLGVLYLLENQYDQAVEALETAIRLGKDEPGVRRNLHYARQKRKEQ
jgi:tetratricopeptide (TPR) repeat protein